MIRGDFLEDRSFLGPTRPTWGDVIRLRDLRHWAQVLQKQVSVLEGLPRSADVELMLIRERSTLETVRREIGQLEGLLASL